MSFTWEILYSNYKEWKSLEIFLSLKNIYIRNGKLYHSTVKLKQKKKLSLVWLFDLTR